MRTCEQPGGRTQVVWAHAVGAAAQASGLAPQQEPMGCSWAHVDVWSLLSTCACEPVGAAVWAESAQRSQHLLKVEAHMTCSTESEQPQARPCRAHFPADTQRGTWTDSGEAPEINRHKWVEPETLVRMKKEWKEKGLSSGDGGDAFEIVHLANVCVRTLFSFQVTTFCFR